MDARDDPAGDHRSAWAASVPLVTARAAARRVPAYREHARSTQASTRACFRRSTELPETDKASYVDV